jgi:catechol 2,3-dioxygenase-like lactoylglutathione lyase family enzyme
MKQKIALISLVVHDYDEAIEFYTQKLNFDLVEDTEMSPSKRWVVVAPKGSDGCHILIAKAANDAQKNSVGNQTGGRVFLFLYTDDFERDYRNMLEKGVEFTEKPREEAYGTVVVFKDLYGNLWDFIEPK